MIATKPVQAFAVRYKPTTQYVPGGSFPDDEANPTEPTVPCLYMRREEADRRVARAAETRRLDNWDATYDPADFEVVLVNVTILEGF